MISRISLLSGIIFVAFSAPTFADTTPSAKRGYKALTSRAFVTALWSLQTYDDAWKSWGTAKTKPKNYKKAVMDRYGLHPAPFDNGRYPMGLREGKGLFAKGLTTDCMACHAGSIMGKSYIGLGNASLDFQSLYEDMNGGAGRKGRTPFKFSNVRGTTEAGSFAVFLMGLRYPDLRIRLSPLKTNIRPNLCEDPPAWWLLKKKKTMYHTGTTPAKSVRSLMQFILGSTHGPKYFEKEEATFRDIQAYIMSLEAPKYPFAVDEELASAGKVLFKDNCAGCHGTYGKKWTYPNRIVPLKVIGTDATRFHGLEPKWGEYYNKSWFAKEKNGWFGHGYKVRETAGYQAPPLDGVWATAPYFHNGSVPTVYHVLNSKSRPKIFTRSYRTGASEFDKTRVGWKVRKLNRGANSDMSPHEQRKIWDTTLPGRGNQGHTFGDHLTEAQRRAVIEYLKTL